MNFLPRTCTLRILLFGALSLSILEAKAAPAARRTGTGRKDAKRPVWMVYPTDGAVLRGVSSFKAEVNISTDADRAGFRVRLNGRDITDLFNRGGRCYDGACSETATIAPADGLRRGHNLIFVHLLGRESNDFAEHDRFDWYPSLEDSPIPELPPTVGLTTVNPGGGNPWIQIYSNGLNDGKTQYPSATDTPCTTTFQVLDLDRSSLTEVSYKCYSSVDDLNAALNQFTANDLVIAGTTYNNNVPSGLDTRPIGGTDYTKTTDHYPLGYIIVGAGGSGAGQAYENYFTWISQELNNSAFWPQANGLLTRDSSDNYNFHPSDNTLYTVTPNTPQGSATITVGSAVFTPPPSSTNGFWVLLLNRDQLNSIPGCAASAVNTYPNCGTFYPTGNSNSSVASSAISALTSALNGADPRDLIVLTAIGTAFTSSTMPTAALGSAFDNLGGSGYTLLYLTSNLTYTLVSSTDTAFKHALSGSAVVSTSYNSQQGQSGVVQGVLARNNHGLFLPAVSSQEPQNNQYPADYSLYQIAFQQPVAWPMMDSPGHLAAYRWLSCQLIKHDETGDSCWPTSSDPSTPHADDIHWWYTGSSNSTIATKTMPSNIPFPGIAGQPFQWTDPLDNNSSLTFTATDYSDVQTQLGTELGHLANAITFFGDTGLRTQVVGSSSGLAWSVFNEVGSLDVFIVSNSQTVSMNWSNVENLAGAVAGFAAVFTDGTSETVWGVLSAALWGAGSAGVINGNAIPSWANSFTTEIGNFSNFSKNYSGAVQENYDIMLDSIYSDWYKLSTTAHKSVTPGEWYIPDQTGQDNLNTFISAGAMRSYYVELLSSPSNNLGLDYWPAQVGVLLSTTGSEFETCVPRHGCRFPCECFYNSKASIPEKAWTVFAVPGNVTKHDIVVFGGKQSHMYTTAVEENFPSGGLVNQLFGSPLNAASLSFPTDLFFSANAPLSRRNGPMYSGVACTPQ